MPFTPDAQASSFKPDNGSSFKPEEPSGLQKLLGKLPTSYVPGGTPAQASLDNPEATKQFAKTGAAMAAGGMLGPALSAVGLDSGIGGAAANFAGNMGIAGAQGAMDNGLEGAKEAMTSPWAYGPAAIGAVAPALAKASANRAMLRSIGATGTLSKKIPADTAQRLIDEGIWGTKAGMAEQVADKYQDSENNIQNLAKSIPGSASNEDLSNAIASKAAQHGYPSNPSIPVSGNEGNVDALKKVADQVGQGPSQYSWQDVLGLKRAGDNQAFLNSGQQGDSALSQAYRAQGDAARNALSSASEGAMPEALKREQALLIANRTLNKPEMVSKTPFTLQDLLGANVGSHAAGLPGAGASILASKAMMTPLLQSGYAQSAPELTEAATNPATQALLRGIFLNDKQNEQ